MTVWVAIALAATGARDPLGELPALTVRSAAVVQSGWEWVKDEKVIEEQAARIAERHLDTAVCTDTIDFSNVTTDPSLPLPYGLRDLVRLRHAARPEMVALLIHAGRLLHKEAPNTTITIGDIAQTGCGQIRYGTITSLLSPADAGLIFADASIAFGAPTAVWVHDPADFLDEFPRFEETDGPIYAEWRATGRLPDGSVRAELRRFDLGRPVRGGSLTRLMSRSAERFAGKAARWDTVAHQLPDQPGAPSTARRGTYVNPQEGLFAEVVLRPGVRRWTGRTDDVLRIREAKLDVGKPTSLKFEERYDFSLDGEAGVNVARSVLEYEAHHASHLSGLDADLSYVTDGNRSHFAPNPLLFDARGSWRWLRVLQRAAAELNIPLKDLFVDRSIYRALKQVPEANTSDPTWKKIHIAPGHDSHVHVRLGAAPRFAGKRLAEIVKVVDSL